MKMILLEPVFKQMIWGGNRMRTEYGYDVPGDNTGECWAISAHPQGDCTVATGEYAGMTLSKLWESHRELFGNATGDRFPLLTKIIDAQHDLSIQVHPDDVYAREHENGSLGKMECWYILDCDEDATIIIGHHAKTKQELEDMIHGAKWKELIREIPVHKGDFFQINPGCVHAIKGGTLILETQQNSDITYRLYDYDRLQDGKKRPLHIAQSLDVITVPFEESEGTQASGMIEDANEDCAMSVRNQTQNGWFEHLITCEYYSVWKAELDGTQALIQDQKFMLGSVIEGSAILDGCELKKGDHFILPAGMGDVTLTGTATFIFSAMV
ncbi:MAG: mannose-6-phosphate isomerase, class I [Lachnospiraceae bacterium]|nr:mannose-6-phosphate isomerase, class I [Lachnospiraceae bacterium]